MKRALLAKGYEFRGIASDAEVSIAELTASIANVSGYRGKLTFDPSRPDGMPRKRLDLSSMLTLGCTSRIPLMEGLREAHAWFADREAR
jgi:nucleoside-diphosphate-sugar epimerase